MISKLFNYKSIFILLLCSNNLNAQIEKPYEILEKVKKNISSNNIHYEFIIENNSAELNNSIKGNLYLSGEKYVLLTNDIEQIFDGEKTYTIIHENEDGLEQVRLTINTFREVEYIHLRKYYLDFNEEWQPSSKGIAMPLNLSNSYELFAALVEILSLAESKDTIMKHFGKIFNEVYNSS